jgi:group I intron endonuclease
MVGINSYMHHIIYKTTNCVNNKIYIGYHCQKCDPYEFDGYLGSETTLLKAIKKYGKENFSRETLFYFNTEEEALAKEQDLLTETVLQDPNVYNLTAGGGKPPSHKGKKKTQAHREKISLSQKGKIISSDTKEKIRIARAKQIINHSPETKQKISKKLLGVPHTEERKQNMRDNQPNRSGERNPCYGKIGSAHPAFGTKRLLVKCPHCERDLPVNTANRWHFDNCKSNLTKS